MQAEPHVTMRAKRIFEGSRKDVGGILRISDTAANCRDLEWFMERYPLEMVAIDRLHLEVQSKSQQERETLVARMMAGRLDPRSFTLKLPPREYQRVAGEFVLQLRSLLLCDDLGLGKTISAFCLLSAAGTRPALVAAQTHLVRQWKRELKRFLPELDVHVLRTMKPYDLVKDGRMPDVVLTTYAKLDGWADTLAKVVRTVVWDEVQEFRTGKSDKCIAGQTLALAATYRMGLTATPIYNNGGEVYNVMQCVCPGALGTRGEFLREWGGEYVDEPKALGKSLQSMGLMMRRTREDVGLELPEHIKIPIDVEMDSEPLKRIEGDAAELARIILSRNEVSRGDKMRASEELSMLVRHATGVGKAEFVAQFVRMLLDSEEKVVLWGWHRDVYAIWKEKLAEFNPTMFTGSESAAAKDREALRFIEGDSRVLLMSLRAGGGLNGLERVCSVGVFGELDWSEGVHQQCIGRLRRGDQKKNVLAYYMLADSGSDPVIADVLQVKRAQLEGIANPDRDFIEKLEVDGDRIKKLAQRYLRRAGAVRAPADA